MRRRYSLPVMALVAVVGSLVVAAPAMAHGYVSSPPSRQALCAQGKVACGAIKYEPQSVEGPKGLRSCNGGKAQFAELNDNSRGWPAASVGSRLTVNWVFTARHATTNWQYYIGNTLLTSIGGNNKQPPATVSHTVNLGGFTGRQTVLAIWNIADTGNAFYSCIDVRIGGAAHGQAAQ